MTLGTGCTVHMPEGGTDPAPDGCISGAPACTAGPPQTRGLVQLMVQIKGS
jgi:hypothetical protein